MEKYINRKNVILFQPSIGYMDDMRTSPTLPLSLLSAVSIVAKFYDIKIIDQRINKNWKDSLQKYISSQTICVGVTCLTGRMISEGVEFSKYVKMTYGLPVVWGGVHPTLLPEETVENENIDIVVIGEGEETFYELVKSIDEGNPLENIKGICFKKDKKIIRTPPRDFVILDKLPDIPYHLVNLDDYLPLYNGRRSIFFQSSRGCPYNCSYCYNNVVNKRKWRAFSAEETLSRIQRLVTKYKNIQDIYFVDDEFFIDIVRAEKIITGLKKMNITWQVQGVDILCLKNMDEQFLWLLKNSGCVRLTVGIESGSQRIREIMNKKGTVEDILSVIQKLKKYNIIIYCSFMVGIDSEKIEDIKETVNLIFEMQKINPNVRNSPFYIYTPYPGTKMYEIVKNKYKIPKSLLDWSNYGEWSQVKYRYNKNFYELLHFVSLFIDKKINEYNVSFIIKILCNIYRPLARWRLKNLYFGFMIEKWFYNFFCLVFKVRKI
ncbi:MAG: B12-binding domain-containing radical SAM protein [Endomicrobiia bacterium]